MSEENKKIVFDEKDVNENKPIAILMLICPILLILPFVIEDKKNSVYLKFYANQLLVYFICGIAAGFISMILAITIIGAFLIPVILIFFPVAWIILLVGACTGEAYAVPLIGEKINIIK